MKNPAPSNCSPHIDLDADPRPSGFPYSTLGGEKAQGLGHSQRYRGGRHGHCQKK
jgi:hypothetical protein